ncbi:MAG: hypothetical protein ACRDNP_01930 [Gaiellaceae bacterium]
MKTRITLLSTIALLGATPLLAQTHNTRFAWTEAKAAKILARDARVQLPAADRKSLESELRESMRALALYRLAAGDGVAQLPDPGHSAPTRFKRAGEKVRDGLMILSATCRGSGAAVNGSRFKHFRCSVASEAIEIPKATLVPPTVEGELPTLVEGPPRIIGPLQTQLYVHVTGRSSIAYRQAA